MRRAALLVILLLLSGCVGQGNGGRDSDGDGLPDDQETTPRDASVTYANGTTEMRSVTSDPHHADTDGDGLLDVDEYALKTDPRSPDTDKDGLLDGGNATVDPSGAKARDWRALGIVEVPPGSGHFVGEKDATAACSLSPTHGSSDLPFPDALPDGLEIVGWNVTVRGFAVHVTSDPCLADTDRDGLPDDVEKQLGADPRNPDTDGDGVRDGVDADPLWDLGVAISNVTATGNGTAARVRFQIGLQAAELSGNGAQGATLDVNDSTPDRASLPVVLVVAAHDATGNRTLDLFGDPRGTYLTLDLLQGTTARANGVASATRHVATEGPDGSLTFDWSVARS